MNRSFNMSLSRCIIITLLSTQLFSQDKFTLNGYVRDAESGESLIGATVYINEISSGTITNPYGFYSITLEEGTYNVGSGAVAFDDVSDGWYAQAVYKFSPNWRVGSRFSAMNPAGVAAGLAGSTLDASGHDPNTISVMADWTNSEFGRMRFQYNREELAQGGEDDQFLLQYVMSIGAHGAHAY